MNPREPQRVCNEVVFEDRENLVMVLSSFVRSAEEERKDESEAGVIRHEFKKCSDRLRGIADALAELDFELCNTI